MAYDLQVSIAILVSLKHSNILQIEVAATFSKTQMERNVFTTHINPAGYDGNGPPRMSPSFHGPIHNQNVLPLSILHPDGG